jgi:hypothetical protein
MSQRMERGFAREGPMIFGWRRQRLAAKAAIEADALALMRKSGDDAYFVAWYRALATRRRQMAAVSRDPGHWERVHSEIGRRTGRSAIDTATRDDRG